MPGIERGEEFCLFNNVAIGTLYAIKQSARRVAVIDFDRHHGNGTEEIVNFAASAIIFFYC